MVIHFEEADQKWCPMVAVFARGQRKETNRGEDVSSVRGDSGPMPGCLGEACMWWVWTEEYDGYGGCGMIVKAD